MSMGNRLIQELFVGGERSVQGWTLKWSGLCLGVGWGRRLI